MAADGGGLSGQVQLIPDPDLVWMVWRDGSGEQLTQQSSATPPTLPAHAYLGTLWFTHDGSSFGARFMIEDVGKKVAI